MKHVTTLLVGLTLSSMSHAINLPSDEQYCINKGGWVDTMTAQFSTQTGFVSGFSEKFCLFEKDNGYIAVGLKTYSAVEPNLATTFMKRLPQLDDASPLWKGEYANPSLNVCKNIGGSSISFHVMSGGFTNEKGQNDICVFGDGSMVSAWSLIYMAANRTGYDEVKNNAHSMPLDIDMPQ